MSTKWMKPFFVVSGLYDGILGLAFLFWWRGVFEMFKVEPPNHLAYLQFPALLLIVFALMFFRIATDPVKFRELILYGMGLKFAYCITVFGHALVGDIPSMWLPWAWADIVFLILFALAWKQTAPKSPA